MVSHLHYRSRSDKSAAEVILNYLDLLGDKTRFRSSWDVSQAGYDSTEWRTASCDSLQSIPGDERKQFQGSSVRVLFTSLPLAH
jgi:hypothetical protein